MVVKLDDIGCMCNKNNMTRPPNEVIHSYYRENSGVFKTWFMIPKIEEASKEILEDCVVVSSQRPLSEVSKRSMTPYFIINVEEK